MFPASYYSAKNHTLWCNLFAAKWMIALLLMTILPSFAKSQQFLHADSLPPKYVPDSRIDNMGYWRRMADFKLVTVQPPAPLPPAQFKGTKLAAPGIATYDSPDIAVTESKTLQSENSVFVNPSNNQHILNSNNSHPAPYVGSFYGADAFSTSDGGQNWEGTFKGPNGFNMGDPTTAISLSGRMYVGYIYSNGGQGISYSDDGGATWKVRAVAPAPGGIGTILDKNHLWIDNSINSPYVGYLYDGWTAFGGTGTGHIEVSRSMDGGLAWQQPVKISTGVAANSHNQGINLHTGPNGEVYAVWSIYDAWPGNENALGFARSLNGGQTWETSKRIINNIKGIRIGGVNKFMRVNSFPSMTVDISNGPNRGNIYVVWANRNYPGVNTGIEVDIYMIRSTDRGLTWSEPIKVNQDEPNKGKQHYLPWICSDPDNGNLAAVFYDDRNTADSACETWVAISKNGGLSWQDFRVSDVSFIPVPLTGLSDNYFGDYLGISAKQGMVYPCWTDNRTGEAMAYVSPFRIGPPGEQAYVDYYFHTLNDTITGNANAIAEYGEEISLHVQMRNSGYIADSAVEVTLSTQSPFIEVIDNNEFYGDFEKDEIKTIQDAFKIKVNADVPNNYRAEFTIIAKNYQDSIYNSSFSILCKSPELTLGMLLVIDSAGNNNNHPDPGEEVTFSIILNNTGNYPVSGISNTLTSLQPYCSISNPTVYTQLLQPGDSDTLMWNATIAGSVTHGTVLAFVDTMSYANKQSTKLYLLKAGVITEDWESANMNKHPWKTSGNKPWVITNTNRYEGVFSAKSGAIGSNQTSALSIEVNLFMPDTLSFYRKVSSELNYDYLSFYIDNLRVSQWSGDKDWKYISYIIPAGKHTLKWEYAKDNGMNSGFDAGWIDFIQFPVQQLTTVNAGDDILICAGNNAQLSATATNYESIQWSTSGSGMFNDIQSFGPKYFPSTSDIAAGRIELYAKVKGYSFGEYVTDTVVLIIIPKPTLKAGNDAGVCTDEIFIASAQASNFESVTWSSQGDGTFSDSSSLICYYTPGPVESLSGFTRLYIDLKPLNGCTSLRDTIKLSINKMPSALFTGDTVICKGDTAYLKIRLSGQGPWRIYQSAGEALTLSKPVAVIPVAPKETTIYQIDSIGSINECIYRTKLSVTVQVKELPDAIIKGPAVACPDQILYLDAASSTVASYLWLPENKTEPYFSTKIQSSSGQELKYTLRVIGTNGCFNEANHIVKVNDDCPQKYLGDIQVITYPNPSDGHFSIMLSSPKLEKVNMKLTSAEGKIIFEKQEVAVSGVTIVPVQLSNHSKGTFILTLQSTNYSLEEKIVLSGN